MSYGHFNKSEFSRPRFLDFCRAGINAKLQAERIEQFLSLPQIKSVRIDDADLQRRSLDQLVGELLEMQRHVKVKRAMSAIGPIADMPKSAINVAIGGKADMTFCGANVCF